MVQRVCALIVLIAGGVPGFLQGAQEGLKWERPADLATTTNVRRVFLEIRLAEAEPVRGLTFEAPVKGTEKKVHIHYATVVTNGDLLKAIRAIQFARGLIGGIGHGLEICRTGQLSG